MNVEDFTAEFRRVMRDGVKPYLYSDDEILGFLNDAVTEACERALLIEDRTSSACCTVTIEEDTDSYDLHASVIRIKRVTYKGRALEETSVEAEDARDTNWEALTGEPCRFIQTDGQLRFVPIPNDTADGEDATLTVYRTPLEPLQEGTDEPEFAQRYHKRLLPWMYRCGFRKVDTETANILKANEHEAEFIAAFGERPDANVQRKRKDRRPPIVRSAW